jgi:hypothetical protein
MKKIDANHERFGPLSDEGREGVVDIAFIQTVNGTVNAPRRRFGWQTWHHSIKDRSV